MTTRREVEALEKLARAKMRSAEAESKMYGALANALKLPKKPAAEPPILPGKAAQKSAPKRK